MIRVEITVGFLAILATVAIVALVGVGEDARMARDDLGWEMRHVESGAQMFDQYCANCHGVNASGGVCPPLDETSGLYGGDLGAGIAWRLEELGWNRTDAYGYITSVIESGRAVSTRPDLYPGNRNPANPDVMAMPAWGQDYGGPLRPDQIRDLASYLAAFRSRVPDDATPRPTAKPRPTELPTATPAPRGTGTAAAAVATARPTATP